MSALGVMEEIPGTPPQPPVRPREEEDGGGGGGEEGRGEKGENETLFV